MEEQTMEKKAPGKLLKMLRDSRGKIWFYVNMIFTISYLMWRVFFTIPFEYGLLSEICGILLLIVELLGMAEALVHFDNMYNVNAYKLPEVPEDRFPHVDVFIATYNEEKELLYKTLNGCLHMDYPDKSKVHIYLCDDGRREEIKALAEELGVNYITRKDNEGAKAGNLNNALKVSSSPYIVTFDADMIPRSCFLMKTIPYFVDAEIRNEGRPEGQKIKLGFVQSPQSFYNADIFQFNLYSEGRIPNEQDYFYRDIQVARTKSNSVIYGGSNTVLAREALEKVGGFYTKSITEDFATGILIQKAGYVSLGVGEPLASGLSVTDLSGLIKQRVRWGRGVIQTGRKMHIFTSKELSVGQKMNYWASIWYWYAPLKRLVYILSPLVFGAFGIMVLKCTLPQVLIFWLPMYISSNISLKMLSGNIRNTKWTGIYETILFPFMLLPVLLETFGISLRTFKVSDKRSTTGEKRRDILHMLPFVLLFALSVYALIRSIVMMFQSNSFSSMVLVFWLLLNSFYLVMAMFFVDGRNIYRKAERVMAKLPARISDDRIALDCTTRDISETGISVLLDKPHYFTEDGVVDLVIDDGRYHSELKAVIVFVDQRDELWNYSMRITDYCGTYDDYLQQLYDRIPTMPQSIKPGSGSFDDLYLNSKKRVTHDVFQKRHLARVQMQQSVPCPEAPGGAVTVSDFNYSFVNLTSKVALPSELTLKPLEGLEIHCRTRSTATANGGQLYSVENRDELVNSEVTYNLLLQWLCGSTVNVEVNPEAGKIAEEKKKEFSEADLV